MTGYDCVVIGAGIAGLLAAQQLQIAGQRVIVLDKARGVGGRMATRRIEDAVFDHGAQFFTVRSERFRALVDHWQAAGVVMEWARGFINGAGQRQNDGHPRYRGAQGMTTIPKHLAQSLDVRTGIRVMAVNIEPDQWVAVAENGARFAGRALLLTPPVPQSLALLDAGDFRLPEAERSALEHIDYHPCIAVMALLDKPAVVPRPGGVQFSDGPISWLADNQRKGISPACGLTIHGAPDFSRQYLEADRDAAAQRLLDAAAPYIGSARLMAYQVHGWRYSQPISTYQQPCLTLPGALPLVFAGDAFAGPRVEGAALSGLAAADYLRALGDPGRA
jgi:renalase